MIDFLLSLSTQFGFTFLFIFVLSLAKIFNEIISPYDIAAEIFKNNNNSIALDLAGHFLGTSIIFAASLQGRPSGFLLGCEHVLFYAVFGVILLNVSRIIHHKLLLKRFFPNNFIQENKHIAVGLLSAGCHLSSGLIISAAINGSNQKIGQLLLYYIIGEILLLIYSYFFILTGTRNLKNEIISRNLSSIFSFVATLLVLSNFIFIALRGSFSTWEEKLLSSVGKFALLIVILPILRFFLSGFIVAGASLQNEIKNFNSISAGIIEFFLMIGMCTFLAFLVA